MHILKLSAAKIADGLALRSEKGVTAVEYGLIAALVAVVIIAAITLLGTNLSTMFNYTATHVTTP